MNQILSTELNRNKTKSTVIDIKKILIFFAVVIIIFGLAIAIPNIIKTYTESKNNVKVQPTVPDVSIEQGEEELTLKINHDKPITKITYSWNDGQEITINGNNRTSITQTITLPDGTNKLTMKITDETKNVSKIEKEYTKVVDDISLAFSLIENKINTIEN